MMRLLRIYVPLAMLLMVICYSYYLLASRDITRHAELEDASLAKLEQQLLEDEFRGFASDLMMFANMQEWKSAFETSDKTVLNELAYEFKTLLATTKRYEKIRLIDLQGKELLRVEYYQGNVSIIPELELQQKSHRYYIAASESLHKNQIYISPMDLNWEHGTLEQPLEPAIRLITPVFDARGEKRGLLVLNVLVESMMQRFMDKHANLPRRSLLVNRQGEWLHDGEMAESWDFLLPEHPQNQFSGKFPEAWQKINQQEHGHFVTQQGMFTFSTLRPLQAAYQSLPNSMKSQTGTDSENQQPVWKIIEHRSHADLATLAAPFGQRIAGYTLLFLLLLAILVWRIAANAGKREKAEQQLRDSESKFRYLIEELPDGLVVIIDAKVVYANQAATTLFCKNSGQSLVGKAVIDFVHTESRQMVLQRLQSVMNGQLAESVEEHLLSIDGKAFFALVTSTPILFEGKQAIQTVIRDMTVQHRAEESLQNRTMEYKHLYTMLRMLCDNMPDMMWAKDMHQRYIFANKALCENLLHAKDTDEPIGKLDMFFAQRERDMNPEDSQWHTFGEICRDSDSITLQSGKAEQFDEFGNVRGKFLFLDVHKAPMLDANGVVAGVVGSARDVTEIKAAELQLLKLQQAIEQAGEAILITDANAVIEYVNPAFSRITGYDAEEVLGQTPAVLNSGRQDNAFYQQFWKKITSGEAWHGSLVDQRKDGSLYPALMSVAPIFDANGSITHYVSIQQDMSEHDELEAKFRQAQKMEALGTLVGGIAHDFNNVLAGMLGNLYMVKKRTASDADVQVKLHRIEQAGQRAAEMIRQLLAFARKEESELTVMPVQPFIKEILKLARSSIPENIGLQHDLGEQDYRIRGDGSQMQQIMLNLLVNASHALEGRDAPAIIVSMCLYEPDDDFLFVHRDIDNKPLLCITIADNGCGISKANLEHVFEPFFTTKAEGKGTGLGLAMVYGSMQNHGGAIDIESEEGTGTRMKLYFPLSASTAVANKQAAVEVISGKDEVILLADDNEQVREIMQEILQDFGYRVMSAENGKQALMMFIDHASEIKLALLDIVMPVMGGVEAAERLRELKPDLPILFLSGYEKGVSPSEKLEAQNITILTKPVDLAELSHHIHKSINK
jgi:PAS domain S-box-containing protein